MTFTKPRLLSPAAVLVLTLGGACSASAQSIDYGSLEQLFNEPVTTSATGSPQRATDAPVDMSIITADDIRRSGATDLPTIISRVAGVDVLNWSAADTDVGIRGYDQLHSPRLLVLIDGREVYLDDFGYTAWSTLPVQLNEIRQIEVVRGPNSALFGFNAVGGVINIITFNPKYDDTNTIEAHGGTQNDVGGSVVKTLHLGDRVSMRLSAGGERQDEWANSKGFAAPWNARGMADAIVQLTPSTELRVEGSLSKSAGNEALYAGVYAPAAYETRSLMATINSDTRFGEIQARYYVNTLDNRDISVLGVSDTTNRISVVSLQDLFKIGTRSTVRIALEYRNNSENTGPLVAGNINYGVVAPSAMWNFAATDKLSLTAAGRVDHLSLSRTGPEPLGLAYSSNSAWNRTIDSVSVNLGAVYKLNDVNTLRATYARGIQVPTLIEWGGFQAVYTPGPGGQTVGGNPYLQPAVVSNYELSFDHAFPDLDAKASVKAFFQQTQGVKGTWDITHPFIGPPPGNIPESLVENASNSTMAGFELAASGKVKGGFHWSADTTYTQVTDKAIGAFDLVGRGIAFGKTTPAFRGNVAAGWSDARWNVDVYVHYVTAYDGYSIFGTLVPTPAYASLAGRVSYQLADGLVAALSGQNLGAPQQNQSLTGDMQAPRRVMFSLTKSW